MKQEKDSEMNRTNNDLDQIFSIIREKAEEHRKKIRDASIPKITIGMATCGIASGALETKQAFDHISTFAQGG